MPTQYCAYPRQYQVVVQAPPPKKARQSWNNIGAIVGPSNSTATCVNDPENHPDPACAWVMLKRRDESDTIDLWDFEEFDTIPNPDTTPIVEFKVLPITRACPVANDGGAIVTHVLGVKKTGSAWQFDGDDHCNCRWSTTLDAWHVGDGVAALPAGGDCHGPGSTTWGLSLTVGDIKQSGFRVRFACESCNHPDEYRADVDAIKVCVTI